MQHTGKTAAKNYKTQQYAQFDYQRASVFRIQKIGLEETDVAINHAQLEIARTQGMFH